MTERIVTPDAILARGVAGGPTPCMTSDDVTGLFAGRSAYVAQEVLDLALPFQRRLWVVLHPTVLPAEALYASALAFAREAMALHGDDLPGADYFHKALSTYDAWLRDQASTTERDIARDAAAAVCRRIMRPLARTRVLAAGWAVVGAGRPTAYEAARMAAYFGRLAVASPRRAAKRQVDLVREVLTSSSLTGYRRDLQASEAEGGGPAPMDNSLSCTVAVINNTNQYLQKGDCTADHGNTQFLVDTIQPNSPQANVVQCIGTTCAEEGATGSASFVFNGTQSLMLRWNIPYTYSCMGNGILPYFYALLQGPQPGQYQVDIENLNLYECQAPPACDSTGYATNISPIVTISALG